MKFREPKQVDDAQSEVGMITAGPMGQILGITRQHLSDLARVGRVPSTIIRGVRRYDVDRVLALASQCFLPLPPLRGRGSYGEDAVWACEALGRGAWNVPTATTGRAWGFYLNAKQDKVFRRRLLSLALKLAERETGDKLGSSTIGGGDTSKMTVAERCLQELDMSRVSGPLAVDWEGES